MRDSQKEFFNQMALKYRSQAILVPGASRFRNMLLDKAMRKALTPILSKFSKMTILDAGCGVGRWSRILSTQNSVVGVDVSRIMIKIANDSCRHSNCTFLVADVSHLPFRENIFELVISITVLQHILDDVKFSKALSEIARCSSAEALIVEEMSSDAETLLEEVYCPIRILPAEYYVKRLSNAGLNTYCLRGITLAPLAIFLTRLFAHTLRSTFGVSNSKFNVKLKTSRVISRLVHFMMGLGVLSAVFMPNEHCSPRLSLHTAVYAKKKNIPS